MTLGNTAAIFLDPACRLFSSSRTLVSSARWTSRTLSLPYVASRLQVFRQCRNVKGPAPLDFGGPVHPARTALTPEASRPGAPETT